MSLEPPALPEVTTAPSARLGPSESDFTPKARTPRLGLPLDQALALAAHNEANVSLDPELAPARGIRLRRPLGAICLTCKAPWPTGFARNPRLALASPGLLALILSPRACCRSLCRWTCVIRVGSSTASHRAAEEIEIEIEAWVEIEIEAWVVWVPSGRGDARRGGEGWGRTQKENEKKV